MAGRTLTVAVLALAAAIVLQVSAIGPLGLPLGGPDLVLMLLACVALKEGPGAGALLGFGTGLVADLLSDHVVGVLTLVFCLVGYVVGLASDDADRTTLVPLTAVAGASAMGTVGYAALSAVLGEPVVTPRSVVPRVAGAALYAVLLTPFLYPLTAAALRRLDGARTLTGGPR